MAHWVLRGTHSAPEARRSGRCGGTVQGMSADPGSTGRRASKWQRGHEGAALLAGQEGSALIYQGTALIASQEGRALFRPLQPTGGHGCLPTSGRDLRR